MRPKKEIKDAVQGVCDLHKARMDENKCCVNRGTAKIVVISANPLKLYERVVRHCLSLQLR